MQFLHDVKTAVRFMKQLRSARKRGANRMETHPVWTVPVTNPGLWGGTMEFCTLMNHADAVTCRTVSDAFYTLPKETQHALTFTPHAPGEWTRRAALWRELLRPVLPPKEFHRVMGCFEHWYARCLRMRRPNAGSPPDIAEDLSAPAKAGDAAALKTP